MKLRNILLSLGLAISLMQVVSSLSAKEVDWTHDLLMQAQPDQEFSRWVKVGEGKSLLEDDGLVLDSSNGDSIYWQLDGGPNDGDWDASRPTTIEFEARAREISGGNEAAGQVVVSDGMNYYAFNISEPEWHRYRIVLNGGQALLFTDGDSGSDETLKANALPEDRRTNQIYFGDGSEAIGGITEWKSFRWTNEGAFAP